MATVVNFIDTTLQSAATRTTNMANAAVLLTPSTNVFHVNAAGANDPASITFTYNLIELDGPATFSATGGTITTSGNVATLTYANMPGSTASVTASVTVNGVTFTSNPCFVTKVLDGATGTGTVGARGAGQYFATGSSWSDATADAATPGANIAGDVVTISNATTFVGVKGWNGSAWVSVSPIYDGGAIFPGTVTTNQLNTNGLIVRDTSGNPLLGVGVSLAAGYEAPGTKNSDIALGADGSLSGGATGQATLSGMGQKTFRVISSGNSSTATPATAGLYVNGTLVLTAVRSYALAIVRRSDGVVVSTNTYDVYGNGANTAGRNAASLAADLNTITSAYIAVVITTDEPQTNRLASGLDSAMYRCGASRNVFGSANFKNRSAYILVGIGGCGEGNGAEAYQGSVDSDTNAWCDMGFNVVGGQLIGTSTSYTPKSLTDFGYTGDLNATVGATIGTNLSGQMTAANISTYIAGAAIDIALIKVASIGSLSALSAELGSAVISTTGSLRSGQTAYNTGTGFWIGLVSGTPKFSIGNPAGAYMTWDGSSLVQNGVTQNNPILPTLTLSGTFNYTASGANSSPLSASLSASGSNGRTPYTYSWAVNKTSGGPSSGPALTVSSLSGSSISVTCSAGTNQVVTGSVTCTMTDANGQSRTATGDLSFTFGTPP